MAATVPEYSSVMPENSIMELPPDTTIGSVAWLTELAANCLNLPAEEIEPQTPLSRYGIDSIAAVELTQAIADALGQEVPEQLLLERPSITDLENYLYKNKNNNKQNQPDSEAFDWLQDLLRDSKLPQDIRPDLATVPATEHKVLLTGATGFLGAHLLSSLLMETPATVICLVRADSEQAGRDRVLCTLDSYELTAPILNQRHRIEVINGTINQPYLGLKQSQYETLCRATDAIYHTAAAVNWVLSYQSLRADNVQGTLELLRFASCYKRKNFYFLSSMLVCYAENGPQLVTESEDMQPYLEGMHLGYARSKWVAEELVRQAGLRGLPVTIFRPSFISGATNSGLSNTADFLCKLIQGCITMGTAPDLDWSLDSCPVDYVAQAITRLACNKSQNLEIFHLLNHRPRHWRQIVLWFNLRGYQVRLLPYTDWLTQFEADSRSTDHPLYSLRSFFLARQNLDKTITLPELYQNNLRSQADDRVSRQSLARVSLHCPSLTPALLNNYFDAFVCQEILPPAIQQKPAGPTLDDPLSTDFFNKLLTDSKCLQDFAVIKVQRQRNVSENSIIGELSSWKNGSRAGLFHYMLSITKAGSRKKLPVFVKAKAGDEVVLSIGQEVATLCSNRLGQAFSRFQHCTNLKSSHIRELEIYREASPAIRQYMPKVYGIARNDAKQHWILVLEQLPDTALQTSQDNWPASHICAAIRGIAAIHADWYGHEQKLLAKPWLAPVLQTADMVAMSELWMALAEHAEPVFKEWAGDDMVTVQNKLLSSIAGWCSAMWSMPRTLIHNDFNPRNLFIRANQKKLTLCVYDWELATLGIPQHDLAELLCFTLNETSSKNDVLAYVELHREILSRTTNCVIDSKQWWDGFKLSLCDLIINRFPMYTVVDTVQPQSFLPHIIRTWRVLYDFCDTETVHV